MSAERTVIDVAKIEELLSQVRGVMAVRVVLEDQGQIDELHIVRFRHFRHGLGVEREIFVVGCSVWIVRRILHVLVRDR